MWAKELHPWPVFNERIVSRVSWLDNLSVMLLWVRLDEETMWRKKLGYSYKRRTREQRYQLPHFTSFIFLLIFLSWSILCLMSLSLVSLHSPLVLLSFLYWFFISFCLIFSFCLLPLHLLSSLFLLSSFLTSAMRSLSYFLSWRLTRDNCIFPETLEIM